MDIQNRKPYHLPEPMLCSAEEPITMVLVNKFIQMHQNQLVRYRYLESMYKGFHDIFKQPDKPDWKPDWRLAVNFPRYITETFLGYGYGIPIKKKHPEDSIDEAIWHFEEANEIIDHEHELEKYCCIYGHAFEYFYQDEQHQTKLLACPPTEMFVVYDDTVKGRALFAVRWGLKSDKVTQYGEVLTRETVIPFEKDTFKEPTLNPYGMIPCVEWQLNSERMGLFESVTGLTELYNHALGEKANDVDAFADAYLAIIGAEVDEKGIRHIRDERLINLYGTDDAKQVLVNFLQKPSADGTQENLLDRLEDLIYEMSMVANISDETFGSSVSGTALEYKLLSMSNLARTFDRKISKSLKKRYKIFCSLGTNVPDSMNDAWHQVEIQTSRNVPKNTLEEAQTAQALEGMVSKETQLSVLSIISNVKAEIERIEKEDAERVSAVNTLADAFTHDHEA